jgi:hypothetical protein
MTKMKTKWICIMATLLAVSSCTREEWVIDRSEQPVYDKLNVRFSSGLEVATKVGQSGADFWDNNDSIGIYMIEDATILGSPAPLAENKAYYTKTGGGANSTTFDPKTPADTIKYPGSKQLVNFISYYPYTATIGSGFTVALNLASQTNLSAIDLLYSNTDVPYNEDTLQAKLRFGHQLSKIEITVTDQSTGADLGAAGAELITTIKNGNTTANFSLVDGSLGTVATPADVVMLTKVFAPDSARSEAIVMPVDDISNIQLTFKVGALELNAKLPPAGGSTKLEAGKRYIYNAILRKDGVNIAGIIEPWDDVNGGSIIFE